MVVVVVVDLKLLDFLVQLLLKSITTYCFSQYCSKGHSFNLFNCDFIKEYIFYIAEKLGIISFFNDKTMLYLSIALSPLCGHFSQVL